MLIDSPLPRWKHFKNDIINLNQTTLTTVPRKKGGGGGGGLRDGAPLRKVLQIILIVIKTYSFLRWFECTNFLQILS